MFSARSRSGLKRAWLQLASSETRSCSHEASALKDLNRLYRPSKSVRKVPSTPSNGEVRTDIDTGVKCDVGSMFRDRSSASLQDRSRVGVVGLLDRGADDLARDRARAVDGALGVEARVQAVPVGRGVADDAVGALRASGSTSKLSIGVRYSTCMNGSIEWRNRWAYVLFGASQILTSVGPFTSALISRNRREIGAPTRFGGCLVERDLGRPGCRTRTCCGTAPWC